MIFFFYVYRYHQYLPVLTRSLPTRRTSDSLLGGSRDWPSVNLAQTVGNTPGQVDGGRDPLPALGADLLAFDLKFFGDQPVEERGIGQPAAIVLLEQVAHHAAAGLDIGLDPDEPHPLVRDAHAVLGQLLPDIGARPVVAEIGRAHV